MSLCRGQAGMSRPNGHVPWTGRRGHVSAPCRSSTSADALPLLQPLDISPSRPRLPSRGMDMSRGRARPGMSGTRKGHVLPCFVDMSSPAAATGHVAAMPTPRRRMDMSLRRARPGMSGTENGHVSPASGHVLPSCSHWTCARMPACCRRMDMSVDEPGRTCPVARKRTCPAAGPGRAASTEMDMCPLGHVLPACSHGHVPGMSTGRGGWTCPVAGLAQAAVLQQRSGAHAARDADHRQGKLAFVAGSCAPVPAAGSPAPHPRLHRRGQGPGRRRRGSRAPGRSPAGRSRRASGRRTPR